jgi:hypothetical protein
MSKPRPAARHSLLEQAAQTHHLRRRRIRRAKLRIELGEPAEQPESYRELGLCHSIDIAGGFSPHDYGLAQMRHLPLVQPCVGATRHRVLRPAPRHPVRMPQSHRCPALAPSRFHDAMDGHTDSERDR